LAVDFHRKAKRRPKADVLKKKARRNIHRAFLIYSHSGRYFT
jgi:hypothetical protein